MPILRYIVWVGTSLLALLFVANWFLPDPPQEAAHETIEKPVIRIASVQRPPESVFIDTDQPTIVPPPMLAEGAIPHVASPLQSYASIEPVVGVDQRNPKKQNKTKIAAHKPPPVVVAANSPPPSVPPTRLSFLDVVSGMGRRLFNLR
jgi:hypothetical protein